MLSSIFFKIIRKSFYYGFLFAFIFFIATSHVNALGFSINCAADEISTSGGSNGYDTVCVKKNSPEGQLEIEKQKSPPGSCNFFLGASVLDCITSVFDTVFGLILRGVNFLLGGLVWVASLILDFTIYFSIVKFKSNFADLKLDVSGGTTSIGNIGGAVFGASGGGLIYYLWGMIRDFLNILIFIIIIYNAVQSMFEGFESTRKKFITLLVFSIVTNFSLLFVKIAIDISNILALQAYTLAVKPASIQDFYQFRTSGTGNVKSYGEYIMTSVDMEKLVNKQTGTAVAQAEIIKGMQNTFMFQLGKMIVYIGVIYIILFMAGLLLMRAVNFLFAMILSPLIAADVFFQLFKSGGEETQRLAANIRVITDRIRGDFYDSLIKGPLLIFFLFMIGVFAESILSTGVMNDLSSSISKMKDVQNVDSSFAKSIFIFFKFALFIFLCRELFTRIQKLTFVGAGGALGLNKFGAKFANFAVGRGLGAAGWAGRNWVSRPLSNSKSGKRVLDSISVASRGLQNDVSLFSPVTNRLGKAGSSLERGLRGGSFDLRNAALDKDGKLNSLGNLIKNINGAVGAKEIDLGQGTKGGFSDADKARTKSQQDKIEADITTARDSVTATQQMKDDALKEAKVELGSSFKGTAKELDDLMKNTKFTSALMAADGGFSIDLGGGERRTITDADLAKFKQLANNQGDFYQEKNQKVQSAVDKKVKDEKDRVEKEMRIQSAEAQRTGSLAILEKAKDRLTGRKVMGVTGTLAREYQKASYGKAQESAKDNLKTIRFIDNNIGTSIKTIKKLVDRAKLSDTELITVKKEIDTLEKFNNDYDKYIDPKNGASEFKKVAEDIFDAKETILSQLSRFSRARDIDENFSRDVGRAKTALDKNEKDYENLKPKDSGKDKKDSGDKKQDAPKKDEAKKDDKH